MYSFIVHWMVLVLVFGADWLQWLLQILHGHKRSGGVIMAQPGKPFCVGAGHAKQLKHVNASVPLVERGLSRIEIVGGHG